MQDKCWVLLCQYSDGSGDPTIIGVFMDKNNAEKELNRIMLTGPSMYVSLIESEILDA